VLGVREQAIRYLRGKVYHIPKSQGEMWMSNLRFSRLSSFTSKGSLTRPVFSIRVSGSLSFSIATVVIVVSTDK
jgi:hypothetical protein